MGTDYGEGVADLNIEIGRKGLRTFDVQNGKLRSPQSPGGDFYWEGGYAAAECRRYSLGSQLRDPERNKNCETPPGENCRCGLYAMNTLGELARQYRRWAVNCVTVIACQGTTYVGSKGLRTAEAQVIAYWCADHATGHREVFAKQCPEAEGFTNIKEMLKAYGFPEEEPPEDYVRDILREGGVKMGPVTFSAGAPQKQAWADMQPMLTMATPGGIAAIKSLLGIVT